MNNIARIFDHSFYKMIILILVDHNVSSIKDAMFKEKAFIRADYCCHKSHALTLYKFGVLCENISVF